MLGSRDSAHQQYEEAQHEKELDLSAERPRKRPRLQPALRVRFEPPHRPERQPIELKWLELKLSSEAQREFNLPFCTDESYCSTAESDRVTAPPREHWSHCALPASDQARVTC